MRIGPAALAPGESLTRGHTTIHFQGPERALGTIALAVLGVEVEDIKTALK